MSDLENSIINEAKSLVTDIEEGFRRVEGVIEGTPEQQATLPQDDANLSARQQQLAKAREDFAFSYDFAPPLPSVQGLPKGQEFTWEYNLAFVPTITEILANHFEALDWFFDSHPELKIDLALIPEVIKAWRTGPQSFLNNAVFTQTLRILLQGKVAHAKNLDLYNSLYKALPAPSVVPLYDEDWTFGYMRVGGFNPTVLRRVEKLPDNFPVTDAMFSKVTGQSMTLDAAGKSGRLYLCDYSILDGIGNGDVHGLQKYVTAPLALFCWIPGGLEGGSLMPVAIQLGQKPDEETPIFTPLDGIKWKIAKAFVQEADGDHHQAVAHLFETHMRVEPAIVATFRELAATHPLNVLLTPHFTFTLAINNDARNQLLIKDGVVDLLLGPNIDGSMEAIGRAYGAWRFDEMSPEENFRRRGVDDATLLPVFPFRDDTLLLWKSICDFVDGYVDLYYRNGQDMAADTELQAWAQCLISNDGARFAGMSIRPNEPFTDVAYLKRVCSQIIYTASAQHASVNYAQYPLMSYAPNCPLALYGPPPTATSAENELSYLGRLPPVSMALWQIAVAKLLTSKQPNQLCHYDSGTFSDPRVGGLIAKVQTDLAHAEVTIRQRNNERRFAYELQLPSKVPNSILI